MKRSRILGLVAAAFFAGAMTANAGVIVGNKEWRQLTETTGFMWLEVAAFCNPSASWVPADTAGACNNPATLRGVSFFGWTWASNDEIEALFEQMIPTCTSQFEVFHSECSVADSADVDLAVGLPFFAPTEGVAGLYESAAGWSRNGSRSGIFTNGRSPRLTDYYDPSVPDVALLAVSSPGYIRIPNFGVWLYRDAAPAPEPTTLTLFGLGLACIGYLRRKRTAPR